MNVCVSSIWIHAAHASHSCLEPDSVLRTVAYSCMCRAFAHIVKAGWFGELHHCLNLDGAIVTGRIDYQWKRVASTPNFEAFVTSFSGVKKITPIFEAVGFQNV